jgi:plastocyanin
MTRRAGFVVLALVLAAMTTNAHAIHFYRNTGGGCSEADGELTDAGAQNGAVTATVKLLHNLFQDSDSGTSETHIKAGEAVRWTWNSSHCHSVQSESAFNSGFHWPKTPPESPQVVPGFFEYPLFDDTPTLSYVHTFTTPGTYSYFCVHHASIGMTGTVVVSS